MSSQRGNLEAMDVVRDPHPPQAPPGQDELPSQDGIPMDTPRHAAQMHLLIETLADAWAERADFFVGGNMFVYFSELQSRQNDFRGPDVFVVLDTDRKKRRKSWVAWQEDGKLPDVVVELLSESTAEIDRGEKKRIYERVWRTAYYVLFDVESGALEGFALVDGRYVAITPDGRGDLAIGNLGLSLGARTGRVLDEDGSWLRWIAPSGAPLPSAAEREARAIAERDAIAKERDALEKERDAIAAERDALAKQLAARR